MREQLLATLPDSPSLEALAVLWSQGVPLAAIWLSGGAVWAWAWAGVNALLCALRAWLHLQHRRALAGRCRPPSQALLGSNLVWFAVMSAGVFGCTGSADLLLSQLGTVLVLGFDGYIVGRYAAFPRSALVLLTGLTLGLSGFAASPLPSLHLMAWLLPFVVLAFAVLMRLQHDILLSAFRSRHESLRLSRRDPLTGLPNRLSLQEELDTLCGAMAQGEVSRFAVLGLDLDGFKEINDRHGHAGGDRLLQGVAERLQAVLRAQDVVSRMGGDEFIIVLPGADQDLAADVARRVIEAASRPIDLGPVQHVHTGLSVGLALAPQHGRDVDRLLRAADEALYRVKRTGKGRCAVYGEPNVPVEA